jgi:hypothetical protein
MLLRLIGETVLARGGSPDQRLASLGYTESTY